MNDISYVVESEETKIFSEERSGETVRRVQIEMFRTGVFKHPKYGRLIIDLPYLKKMQENWKNKVHKTQVSFDKDHNHASGAVAWLPFPEQDPNAVFIKRKTYEDSDGNKRNCYVLCGVVDLTPLGEDLLQKKIYRYFSSEIDPDFQPYEMFYDTDANGQLKEKENKRYGPTIKGGAITNFPFIIGMEPISLSFSDTVASEMETPSKDLFGAYDKKDGNERLMIFSSKDLNETFSDDLEESEPVKQEDNKNEDKNEYDNSASGSTTVLSETTPAILETNPKSESNMNLATLLASLAGKTTQEQITVLESSVQVFSADSADATVVNSILQSKRDLAQKEDEFKVEMQKRLAKDAEVVSLQETNRKLSILAEENKQLAYKQQVQVFCADLEKDKHHQSVINAVQEKLEKLSANQRDHRFSFVDGEKTDEVTLFEVIKDILDSLPEDARFSDKETLEASGDSAKPEDLTPPPKAEKTKYELFVEKHGATYGFPTVDSLKLDTQMCSLIGEDGEILPATRKTQNIKTLEV